MEPEITKSRPWLTLLRVLWILAKFAIAALFIAIPIRWFVAQPFVVSGMSMAPNIEPGEYLVIDKLSYHLHELQRGDIIIFHYPLDPNTDLVKRVVGLPSETVSISNGIITILSKEGTSTRLYEPYIVPGNKRTENQTTTLAADEYFVLGDNRTQTSDSRDWGPLQEKFIIGRAFARLLPLARIGLLPAQFHFPTESSPHVQ